MIALAFLWGFFTCLIGIVVLGIAGQGEGPER